MAKFKIPPSKDSVRCPSCNCPHWYSFRKSDNPEAFENAEIYEDEVLLCQGCKKKMPDEMRKDLKLAITECIDTNTGETYIIRGDHSPNNKR